MPSSAARPFRWRLTLLGWTLPLLVMSLPVSLPLFLVSIVGIPLIGAFGVGIAMILAAAWLTRVLTDVHRWIFASALGVTISRPYVWPTAAAQPGRRMPPGHPGAKVIALARDPATWRDLAWLLVNATLGFVTYLVVITLFALSVLPLWWWLVPPLMRGYARLSGTLLGPTGAASLAARVQQLTDSRAETVDAQAAELRRIERDLHDGAQAQLTSLGMNIGMAEELLRTDPDAAARLLAEAREGSGQVLADLRDLVHGIHPPVLADRGLSGAVEALVLAHPLPVEVEDRVAGRPPAPVESAAYFAVAETLTNITKHARASSVQLTLDHDGGRLRIAVHDDGRGGAVAGSGGGLHGIGRRLFAFDGTVNIDSPEGGPTTVTMEIPCELSSAKTTPSSETG
ncbi:sensor histidine kinase [Actinobacteria bacterium YIM 96077]|uniref:histidine kinase n=1 Tax=Phytoactinopolyspora halophila TaxID=1981511 RepID=A0A329QYV2_9ACTN|nr:sensor domain-containing protein [Phytoactinopolyspora halophila]AYY13358.1 sensor histidine kinase [Actinobacteria bacterium YIM 96077]RAW17407.1 sensor histidine kinase [Phytoactinopolyspora halophila]